VKVSKYREVQVQPSETLLYAVYFSLGMTVCLTALEAVHIIVLGRWNSEVFAAITGLSGTVTGIIVGQRAT
jgi:hypothetical protein